MKNIEIILSDIASRCEGYTPQWLFNKHSPDAGAALALMWSDMLGGTLDRLNKLPENYHISLLNAVGPEPQPALASRGTLVFDVREDVDEIIIPAGTLVSSPDDVEAMLMTDSDLTASPNKIIGVYSVLPQKYSVYKHELLSDIKAFFCSDSCRATWTFRHPFGFRISKDSALHLLLTTNGSNAGLLSHKWEYSDGSNWNEMQVSIEDNFLSAIFPEGSSGLCDAIRMIADYSNQQDMTLQNVKAYPFSAAIRPCAVYSDNAQEGESFFPFGERFLPGNCIYFACTDALSKPGASIELSFRLDYEQFEIEGYAMQEIHLKRMMRSADFAVPETYEITAAKVCWEYYNGLGWAALAVSDMDTVFNGQSKGRISMSFNCPPDLQFAVVGAHNLPFIRARLISVNNLYRQRGHFLSPRVYDVRFSYRFRNGLAVSDISLNQYMTDSEINLPSELAAKPNSPTAMYFAFARPLSQGSIFMELDSGDSTPDVSWEYFSTRGWQSLNVNDATNGMHLTGIVNYQTAAASALLKLWGQSAYWIRLCLRNGMDNSASYSKLRILSMHENAVCSTATIPGAKSVLPAKSFSTLIAPPPGVSGAYNPLPTFGGCDGESEASLISRMSNAFSNRNRAVSASDFEAMAIDASPLVLRAKLYSNTDESGSYSYGKSCLVILPQEGNNCDFRVLKKTVADYIDARRSPTSGVLFVTQPGYISINVTVRVSLKNQGEALDVKTGISDALETLLQTQKWEIGQVPAPDVIESAIRAVSGVRYIVSSDITYIQGGYASDFAHFVRLPFILPTNGVHKISFELR